MPQSETTAIETQHAKTKLGLVATGLPALTLYPHKLRRRVAGRLKPVGRQHEEPHKNKKKTPFYFL